MKVFNMKMMGLLLVLAGASVGGAWAGLPKGKFQATASLVEVINALGEKDYASIKAGEFLTGDRPQRLIDNAGNCDDSVAGYLVPKLKKILNLEGDSANDILPLLRIAAKKQTRKDVIAALNFVADKLQEKLGAAGGGSQKSNPVLLTAKQDKKKQDEPTPTPVEPKPTHKPSVHVDVPVRVDITEQKRLEEEERLRLAKEREVEKKHQEEEKKNLAAEKDAELIAYLKKCFGDEEGEAPSEGFDFDAVFGKSREDKNFDYGRPMSLRNLEPTASFLFLNGTAFDLSDMGSEKFWSSSSARSVLNEPPTGFFEKAASWFASKSWFHKRVLTHKNQGRFILFSRPGPDNGLIYEVFDIGRFVGQMRKNLFDETKKDKTIHNLQGCIGEIRELLIENTPEGKKKILNETVNYKMGDEDCRRFGKDTETGKIFLAIKTKLISLHELLPYWVKTQESEWNNAEAAAVNYVSTKSKIARFVWDWTGGAILGKVANAAGYGDAAVQRKSREDLNKHLGTLRKNLHAVAENIKHLNNSGDDVDEASGVLVKLRKILEKKTRVPTLKEEAKRHSEVVQELRLLKNQSLVDEENWLYQENCRHIKAISQLDLEQKETENKLTRATIQAVRTTLGEQIHTLKQAQEREMKRHQLEIDFYREENEWKSSLSGSSIVLTTKLQELRTRHNKDLQALGVSVNPKK